MNDINAEYRAFKDRQLSETANARQMAALHLACGIDLAEALAAAPEAKARLAARVERAIERERLRGMRRHWSYDLNRHIALKQALDRLRGGDILPEKAEVTGRPRHRKIREAKRRPKAPFKPI